MNIQNALIEKILEDITNNRLEFPMLPEIAIRVRKLVDDPNTSTSQLAKAISTEPVLTTRLIRVANGAMFGNLPRVDNPASAVKRMGYLLVKNLVTSFTLRTLNQNKLPAPLKKELQIHWQHNTKVAALSHVIAKKFTNLNPEEAMMAGLLHDIGVLPILTCAKSFPEFVQKPALLEAVIQRLHSELGRIILQSWRFPQAFIDAASHHEDLLYMNTADVNYLDVVIIANLHSHLGTNHRYGKSDWSNMPALQKLRLTPEQSIKAMKDAQREINEIYQFLTG